MAEVNTVAFYGDPEDEKRPMLVQDDDGMRWLLLWEPVAPTPNVWAQAYGSGAAAIVAHDGRTFAAILAERFMERRTETSFGYSLADSEWKAFGHFPSYPELFDSTPQEAQEAPEGPVSGFVHLHTHAEYSPLDGLSNVDEIMTEVSRHGQQAVAITDHGTCAGHPDFQIAADAAGIKPIFGIEAYLVNDRIARPGESPNSSDFETKEEYEAALAEHTATVQYLKNGYYHLVLWAENETGLRNIWAMTTESQRDGFYYKPRMDWDTLRRHSEGVIASTGCLRGPVADEIVKDNPIQAQANLGKLLEIFGADNLFLEIHTNGLDKQRKVNEALIKMSSDYQLPLVAVVDSHYPTKAFTDAHKVWIACQTNSDVQDEGDLFAEDLDLYIQSEEEVRANLAYLGADIVDAAVSNTAVIANRCTARLQGKTVMPIFSRSGGYERDADRLLELCLSNWERKTTGKNYDQATAIARFEREFKMLRDKKFCGYFLMVADYVGAARAEGILVGPGRGSGGGSLVAYLAGITGIDPVEADLLFERFLTEGRTSLPDFDVDFPSTKREWITHYIEQRYGPEHVVRVGTHTRLKTKGVVKDVARAISSRLPLDYYPDIEAFSKFVKEAEASTAGLGLPWESLWDEHGETLQPYRDKYPELFEMADQLVGRLKSYGRHAAGVVISPDENLYESLPLRRGEDGQMIAEFDLATLEKLGYVKFDLLTIRNLDTLQDTIDLIQAKTGEIIDPDSWDASMYADEEVWKEIGLGHTKGLFQIETPTGTRMSKRMRPLSLSEGADLITIVRPGPRLSGLDNIYLARRSGAEAVSFPDPRLEEFLGKTFGTLLYQEDIMATCMVLGGYDSTKADEVRKILGKKQVEKVEAAGREFVQSAVERGMAERDAAALWAQMAEFAKYSFNRAHAWGYAMIMYWCGWFKINYPVEFMNAILSTVDKGRIPEFVSEARRMGIAILPPDINRSQAGFTPGDGEVRYGLTSVKGVGDSAVNAIIAQQPFTSWEDFLERKTSAVNSGVVALLAKIGAFDGLVPNRKALVLRLAEEKSGVATQCIFKDPAFNNKHDLPCHFDWDAEPAPINPRNGKTLKKKAPPKKCTKACRNYTAPEPRRLDSDDRYSDAEVMEIEQSMLGVYLTVSPFEEFEDQHRTLLREEAERAAVAEAGSFVIGGIVTRVSAKVTNSGQEMAFCTIETEGETIDFVIFNKKWVKFRDTMRPGELYVMEIEKNSRGANMLAAMPVTAENRSSLNG
jgi:DNA polymerase-3 subunit alpha